MLADWIRRAVRETAACVLYYSGLLYLIAWVRRYTGRRRLYVMMYHHLAPAAPDGRPVHGIETGLAPGHFAGHLRVLGWFGRFVPLESAPEALARTDESTRAMVAVTFDDGYRDNLTVGLPALARRGLPATLFPALRPLETGRRLWWDEVIRLAREAPGQNGDADAAPFDDVDGLPADEAGRVPRPALAEHLSEHLSQESTEERERTLGVWRERLGAPETSPNGLYVNWDELREMADSGVAIGGHTFDHPCLTAETADQAVREIGSCRRILADRTGQPVGAFCYPGGEYNDAVRQMVADAGYRTAVTVEAGVNYAHTDPLRLKRVPLSWEAPRHLALKLAFYDFVHKD